MANCNKQDLLDVGNIHVWTLLGNTAFFYISGMAIDADGAPKAYHPDGRSGLDALANAGHPGNWWALVTDNGDPSGNPVIQQANDPAPGFYISMTSLQDKTKDVRDPHRYVDSTVIPYIVLPSAVTRKTRAKLGDFAVVVNKKTWKTAYAIFADGGPPNKLGEGSMALADALDIPSNPRRGGASGDVIYVVFPGSGNGKPRSVQEINDEGENLINQWGGIPQLKECFA
jgi:hypothetical protein